MIWARMALYTVAAMLTAAGVGQFDPAAGTLTLQLDDIAAALAGAGVVNAIVLRIWGKR